MSATIENTIIGTLTEHGSTMDWQGEINLPCFDEPITVNIHLIPNEKQKYDAETIFTPQQRDFLSALQNSCDDFRERWLSAILSELQADPTIWGMWTEEDEVYEIASSVEDVDTLAEMTQEPRLDLLPNKDGNLVYGFGFMNSEWDEEHGYGVVFIDNNCVRGGPLEPVVDEIFQSIDGYDTLMQFYENNP